MAQGHHHAPASEMTPPRTSGRSADSSDHDEITKKAKIAIAALGKPALPGAAKADLIELLEEVIKSREHLNQPEVTLKAAQTSAATNRFDAIDQKLEGLKIITEMNTAKVEELKTVITTSSERTWAQVAATPNPSAHTMRRQQAEDTRRERAKFVFTLSTKLVTEAAKKELALQHPKEITARCQQAIDRANIASPPKVQGINPPRNDQIRLQFKTVEELRDLQEVNWSEAYEGLKANKPKYGVVIHGVAKSAVDLKVNHDETIKEWEKDNETKGIKIAKVIPLRRERNEQGTGGKHHSIVVFTHDPVSADHCIRYGFFIDKLWHKTARYTPQYFLTQCYKCHEFGHRAMSCKRKEKCGKCAHQDHTTANCTSAELKCVNCKGNHEAWHVGCQAREQENQRLSVLKKGGWGYFTDTYQ